MRVWANLAICLGLGEIRVRIAVCLFFFLAWEWGLDASQGEGGRMNMWRLKVLSFLLDNTVKGKDCDKGKPDTSNNPCILFNTPGDIYTDGC
jgi:hypothetical protein